MLFTLFFHSQPTLKPTASPSSSPVTGAPSPSPTYSGTFGSTPTVSKDTTGPPTEIPDRVPLWQGDAWNSDRHGTVDYATNKCKQAERETCCNQPSHWSESEKSTVCELLGCNLKKCGAHNEN